MTAARTQHCACEFAPQEYFSGQPVQLIESCGFHAVLKIERDAAMAVVDMVLAWNGGWISSTLIEAAHAAKAKAGGA